MIRIVKMIFQEEKLPEFEAIFNEVQPKISAFEGCNGVQLLQDINHKNILFTYSFWESETHLNNYRHSELFETTWAKTKAMFADKPEAWSVEKLK